MQANHRVENWGGTIVSYPQKLVRPTSLQEIQHVVTSTTIYPSPLRAVGSNHSTTECGVANGGTLIEMGAIAHIRIDAARQEVTAGAGALYVDVAEALAKQGFQLFVNPEIGNVSIGSACCGGTKDASMHGELPQVSSYCVRMRVIRPDGREEVIADEPTLQVMRSSYGLLGIVYEATFRIKPAVPMKFTHRVLEIEQFIAEFDTIRQQPKSMMLYVLPFIDRIVIEYREELPPGPFRRRDAWKWRLRNVVWKSIAPGFARIFTRAIPWRRPRYFLIDWFNRLVVLVLTTVLSGNASHPKDQVIRYPDEGGLGMYTFSIWAFSEKHFVDTLLDYVAFVRAYDREHGYRCNMLNVGYRFAEDKGSKLSYSFTGDMWSLDVVSTGDPGWDQFVWSYNRFCSDHDGKPLFNQTRSITPEQAKKAFGQLLVDFAAEVRRVDPQGRFLNRYFAWLL